MKNLSIYIALVAASFSLAFGQNIIVNPIGVNTDGDDFSSGITLRANEMYFTADKSGEQTIYHAKLKNGKWEIMEKVDSDVNSGDQNGSATLTPDGQYMIFASYEHSVGGMGRTDLYSARKVNGSWTDVQNLGMAVNSKYWDSQPSLTSDGRTLFFVSDRPASKEGTNIFYSERTREGWSLAKELTSVNTDADEMSPFIAADNKTFTYSSNKSGGQGGFDIYFAKINSSKNAFDFKNAGAAINTEYDEHFYVVAANSETAFFSTNKPSEKANFNIYSAVPNPHVAEDVVFVHGKVTDVDDNTPLGSDITITDLTNGQVVANLRSDDITSEYSSVLTAGRNYSITAEKDGYLFYSENFNISSSITSKDITKDISLSKIAEGKTRLLIFFDFDKSTLQNESKPELERLTKFMNDNPNVKIELHGHTDDRGAEDYNNNLSLERAKAVKDYLYNNGVQNGRIGTKGFGESKPLIVDTTEEARAKNRRVELVIVSI